jgi:hypothetical protein
MANRPKRTPEKDEKFFDALSVGATVGQAARSVGYGRRTAYEWREADADFAARWHDAIEDAVERMEAEADRRAVDGTLKPVFHLGAEVGYIREFSDTLLIFRLKALRPAVYRERFEHTGHDGKDLFPPETDSTKIALALLAVLRGAKSKEPTPPSPK